MNSAGSFVLQGKDFALAGIDFASQCKGGEIVARASALANDGRSLGGIVQDLGLSLARTKTLLRVAVREGLLGTEKIDFYGLVPVYAEVNMNVVVLLTRMGWSDDDIHWTVIASRKDTESLVPAMQAVAVVRGLLPENWRDSCRPSGQTVVPNHRLRSGIALEARNPESCLRRTGTLDEVASSLVEWQREEQADDYWAGCY